jgi:AAA domain/FaeA-like protein
VIIDTLAKCAGLAEEASSTEMRPFIRACQDLRNVLEECGTTVLIVHHFGKNPKQGGRGTSALPSDTDFSLEMHRDEAGRITLHADKLKDHERPPDMGLSLRKVYLEEKWGTESSCVIERGSQANVKSAREAARETKDQPVLSYLNQSSGVSTAKVAEATGQDADNTRKQLIRLEAEGKVRLEKIGRATRWFVRCER